MASEATLGQSKLLIYNKITSFGLRGHSRPKSVIKNHTKDEKAKIIQPLMSSEAVRGRSNWPYIDKIRNQKSYKNMIKKGLLMASEAKITAQMNESLCYF